MLCIALVLTGIHSSPTSAAGVPPSSVKAAAPAVGMGCGWRGLGTRLNFTVPDGSGVLQGAPTGNAFASVTVDQDLANQTFQVLSATLNFSRAYVTEVTGETGGTYPHWEALPFLLNGPSPVLDVSSSGNFTGFSLCLIGGYGHLTLQSTVDAGPGGIFRYNVYCRTPDGELFASENYTLPTAVGIPGTVTFDVPYAVNCEVRTAGHPNGYVHDADHVVGYYSPLRLLYWTSAVMHNQLGTFDLEVKTTKLLSTVVDGQVNYVFQVAVTNLGTVGFTPSPDVNDDAYLPLLIETPTTLEMPKAAKGRVVGISSKFARWEIPSIAAGETITMFAAGQSFPAPVESYVPEAHDVCASVLIEGFARTPHETTLSNNSSCVSVNP